MGSYTTLSDAGEIIGDGKIVVLEPEKWIGKRFPLLDFIDTGDKLREGKWLVLLYHYGCPKCKEAIRDLPRISHILGVQQVALVEAPPYGDDDEEFNISDLAPIHRHLANTREWFVASPLGLLLDKGVVSDVRQDKWFAGQIASNVEHNDCGPRRVEEGQSDKLNRH